jgi:hypothetical protein
MPNYYNIEKLIISVRKIIIDSIDDPDIANFFSRNDIIDAFTVIRVDFFGMMPEAFSTPTNGLVVALDENVWSWADGNDPVLLDIDGQPLTDIDGNYLSSFDAVFVDVNGWAINRLLHGIAGWLLEQRGKDGIYRKAAVQIQRTYYGMLPSASTSANSQSNRTV